VASGRPFPLIHQTRTGSMTAKPPSAALLEPFSLLSSASEASATEAV